jgi:hypothetical protein
MNIDFMAIESDSIVSSVSFPTFSTDGNFDDDDDVNFVRDEEGDSRKSTPTYNSSNYTVLSDVNVSTSSYNSCDYTVSSNIVDHDVLFADIDDNKPKRQPVLSRQRPNRNRHIELLLQEGQFHQHFRVTKASMEILVCILADELRVDEKRSFNRTKIQPLSPDEKVMLTLSVLSGGDYRLRIFFGVSKSYFYEVFYETLDAIIKKFDFRFPETSMELDRTALEFSRVSDRQIISGCVGAIDGWLLKTVTPTKKQVGLLTPYYSGRYKGYGRNVQALFVCAVVGCGCCRLVVSCLLS